MAHAKTLTASGLVLHFKPVEGSGSAQLFIDRGRGPVLLGDQNAQTMRDSLLAFLEGRSEQPKALHPDRRAWQLIFATAQPYHFAFGRSAPPGFVLKFWNGSEGQVTTEVVLDEANAETWRRELAGWER